MSTQIQALWAIKVDYSTAMQAGKMPQTIIIVPNFMKRFWVEIGTGGHSYEFWARCWRGDRGTCRALGA
ncbi:hypothetical protein FIBSPDRAFT_880471 [Athelia psychrophila]|uniref:Uncharacterized protein n=1 Tax=Athelia psychrophila TaxID=1759441 RepID=A0A167SU77_9AGAM|nr:hypothetical protein FIBSPDRAFT_880471 [Fibularhizoctonia sp. CBS 109695]